MTRAEIMQKFPGAVDYLLSGFFIIHTGHGYYARFDETLDFYFGEFESLSLLKKELLKYQLVTAA